MYYLIIAGLVKIVLNYCCVTVFNMTVDGVAIATITSNIISGGLAFLALVKNSDKASFRFSRMRFFPESLKKCCL
jgi:Na+-driven multidrug efflux pump